VAIDAKRFSGTIWIERVCVSEEIVAALAGACRVLPDRLRSYRSAGEIFSKLAVTKRSEPGVWARKRSLGVSSPLSDRDGQGQPPRERKGNI